MHIEALVKKAKARQAFMRWLANAHPSLAARAARDSGMSMLGDFLPDYLSPPKITETRTEYVTQSGVVKKSPTVASPATVAAQESWWKSSVNNITKALPELATSYAQIRLVNTNLQRASNGLPPIDPASIAPTVKVQGSIDPALMRNAMLGVGILAAALVLPKLVR